MGGCESDACWGKPGVGEEWGGALVEGEGLAEVVTAWKVSVILGWERDRKKLPK